MTELTELQETIVEAIADDPDATDGEIAEQADCSRSYVNEVRNEYSGSIGMRQFAPSDDESPAERPREDRLDVDEAPPEDPPEEVMEEAEALVEEMDEGEPVLGDLESTEASVESAAAEKLADELAAEAGEAQVDVGVAVDPVDQFEDDEVPEPEPWGPDSSGNDESDIEYYGTPDESPSLFRRFLRWLRIG